MWSGTPDAGIPYGGDMYRPDLHVVHALQDLRKGEQRIWSCSDSHPRIPGRSDRITTVPFLTLHSRSVFNESVLRSTAIFMIGRSSSCGS